MFNKHWKRRIRMLEHNLQLICQHDYAEIGITEKTLFKKCGKCEKTEFVFYKEDAIKLLDVKSVVTLERLDLINLSSRRI